MKRTKSRDPTDRMGVFNQFEDVPEHHRLERYAADYEGRDVWAEFCKEQEYNQGSSEKFRAEVDRVGRTWCVFMAARGRHHALATPGDVEAWSSALLAEKSERRAHDYWLRIRRFYDWLQWHTEHPHVYNPVVMAVVEGESARRIWMKKIERWEAARQRYEENTNEDTQ